MSDMLQEHLDQRAKDGLYPKPVFVEEPELSLILLAYLLEGLQKEIVRLSDER